MTASQSCSSCGQSYPTNHFPALLLSVATPAPISGSGPNLSDSTTSDPTTSNPTTSDSNNPETNSFSHPTQSSPPTTTTPNNTSIAANSTLA
ncbi:uncharacterized protein UHO2_04519 [Ustilago hordei]|uniref:Uncharacterized protein n=1 Tax=Ustilago hordei TaxID=120017 RepID=I2FVN5_USTHO|nr:uncharacterized protein UHO2_04519 [Ustilago hordei]CCF50978.1 uncharacterized protein UHOR_06890 [Ustilago hordei]SYW84580.1 uncharacterized protein UHO2_04519 [Ustilago hordei]